MGARHIIETLERDAPLLDGSGDRVSGYAIVGLPFQSGHVLALRRFTASTIGPGYTSVWHRGVFTVARAPFEQPVNLFTFARLEPIAGLALFHETATITRRCL